MPRSTAVNPDELALVLRGRTRTASASTAAVNPRRRPLDAANVGDTVQGQTISLTPSDVIAAKSTFDQKTSADPGYAKRLLGGVWDPDNNPNVVGNAKAQAVLHFVQGMAAFKAENGEYAVPVVSQRRTMNVDGVPHVYAVRTPPGPKPKAGWPTVVFFHGSFGGNAPEQQDAYQQANAVADAKGFQVLYPVGTPQDRADSNTGRGMLNWDPVNTASHQALASSPRSRRRQSSTAPRSRSPHAERSQTWAERRARQRARLGLWRTQTRARRRRE